MARGRRLPRVCVCGKAKLGAVLRLPRGGPCEGRIQMGIPLVGWWLSSAILRLNPRDGRQGHRLLGELSHIMKSGTTQAPGFHASRRAWRALWLRLACRIKNAWAQHE